VLLPFQTQSLWTVLLVSDPFHQAVTASRIETPPILIWFHHMVVVLLFVPIGSGSAGITRSQSQKRKCDRGFFDCL
jgi:hypothetical protein